MIKKVAPDKWRHFFAGIIMGAILQASLLYLIPTQPILGSLLTLVLVISISYGFEYLSKITGRGHHDVLDAVATIIGGLLGMGITILLEMQTFFVINP